jgi:hypothetical protein
MQTCQANVMHRTVWAMVGLALLAGCGEDAPPQAKAVDDAKDVAMVERMNQPPFRPIRPEPFTAADVDQYDLARAGCMFRPGDKPDEAPLFIAQRDRGYLKIEGRLQPLSVRTGSAELPSGAHSIYVGTQNWVELVAQAGHGGTGSGASKAWPSRLVIRDANERVAYDAVGQVSCVVGGGGAGSSAEEPTLEPSASDEA